MSIDSAINLFIIFGGVFMRKIITTLFLFICLMVSDAISQVEIPEHVFNMENSNLGREFFVAFPQNDVPEAYNDDTDQGNYFVDMAVYVSSYKNTSVTLTLPNGKEFTKDVEAFKNTVFSVKNEELTKSLELDSALSEIASKKGIHVESEDPVLVYVVSSRIYSEEAYLALPVESWDTEYIHCSSYDQNYGALYRAGGFIVLASEDNTVVNVTLRGRGDPSDEYNRTQKRHHKIGDEFSVTLSKGETYLVQGAARTRGKFDFSGSLISATNPIGLISFHHNTRVSGLSPSTTGEDSRNNIMEMIPPISQWGKEFISLEFFRSGQRGDFFRVVAAEDGTNWSCKMYDFANGQEIDDLSGSLNAGEFYEYNTIDKQGPPQSSAKSVLGIAKWTSDKPIMLIQYAYSENWDEDPNWDPVMTVVPPNEQHLHAVVGSFPMESDFKGNDMYFVFGDPEGKGADVFQKTYFNGYQIELIYPDLANLKVPESNYYYMREIYPYSASGFSYFGESPIGGILTGVSDYKPYGRPLALGTSFINSNDDNAPTVEFIDESEGAYNYTAKDDQESDIGISKITLDQDASFNFLLEHDPFKPQNMATAVNFSLMKADPEEEGGKAYFYVIDRAGNRTKDSLILGGGTVVIAKVDGWDADTVMIETTKCHEEGFAVTNEGEEAFEVTRISLSPPFTMSDPTDPALPVTVDPGKTVYIKELCFTPIQETSYTIEGQVEINGGEVKIPVILNGVGAIIDNVEENDQNVTFLKVFPRPSENQDVTVFLNLVKRSQVQLDLFDQEGNLVLNLFSKDLNPIQKDFTIPVGGLSSGIYYVKLRYNGGTITEKVIINK
jgi:hypothetical protein